MNKEFVNKTVIVTGAGQGIGRATSKLFAKHGAQVVVVDINCDKGMETVKKIADAGGEAFFIEADLSNNVDCKSVIDKTLGQYGPIDVLFNNAGTTLRKNIINTTENEWNKIISINLNSVFFMCKHAIPIMKNNGGGKIVNNASGWGLVGGAKAVSYCASKGGIVLLTKALAIDHGKDGININCICPGDTNTQMLVNEAKQLGLSETSLLEEGVNRPLGRVGHVDEIAEAVLFLSSDRSSFVTGTEIVIDGGGLAGSA